MEVALSWDLVAIIFFMVIMSYSYIVGQNGTIKIILSSYIAMLASNGIGNLVAKYLMKSEPIVQVLTTTPEENIIIFKMLFFVVITLILVMKGGFMVDINRQFPLGSRLFITTVFGFLSAALVVSTLLVYVAGVSADGVLVTDIGEVIDIPHKTLFVDVLIKYYNFWFAAPAIAFVGLSMLSPSVDMVMEE